MCAGTNAWRLDHPLGPSDAIEGFVSPASVGTGGSVQLYVTTTAATYTYAVYRLGYYKGTGGRLMYTSQTITGVAQPAPQIDPATRMVSCDNWTQPHGIAVGSNWVSGVYVVKLLSSDGYMRYAFFVVRNDTSASPVLVELPLLTYQAYNRWGGYSLYYGQTDSGQYTAARRAYAVSFDRPFDRYGGLAEFSIYDYPLVSWLERSSYSASYDVDVDIGLRPEILQQHKLILVAGHSEYWSTAMRQNIISARDAGVSLAFFGANDIYWHVRLQNSPLGSNRIVVCYKAASLDPMLATNRSEVTVQWQAKPLNAPSTSILGQAYGGEVSGSAPLVLAEGSQQFLTGTTLQAGAMFPELVGGEYDRVDPSNQPSSLIIISASPISCIPLSGVCTDVGTDSADATIYTASSGAKVFDAGTFHWSWGLSDEVIVANSGETSYARASADVSMPGANPSALAGDALSPSRASGHYSNPDFQLLTENILAYLLQ